MEITIDDVKKCLASMGYIAPNFLLENLILITNKVDDCMSGAGYDEATQKLIKLYSVILMLSSSDVRRVSSESSPSGASRSYQYFDDSKSSLMSMLSKLDTNNCTESLPINLGSFGQFKVLRG